MKFTVERDIKASRFGGGKEQYGSLLVVSKDLAPYIGKTVRIKIEITDKIEANG